MPNDAPALRYHLDLAGPGHEIQATLVLDRPAVTGGRVRLFMPSWTPGSYLIREYARHVDLVSAEQGGGPCAVEKTAKDEWSVSAVDGSALTVRWRLHAHELTVRTNYLGPDRALLCGAATFLLPVGSEPASARVSLTLPEGWPEAECALPREDGAFVARSIDQLLDSPIAAGPCRDGAFDVEGVPHRLVVHGAGDLDVERLTREVGETCRAAAAVFGGPPPMNRYLFLVQMGSGGGLEHCDSSVCGLPTHPFASEADRRRHLSLFAHEYFHVWNVKRIRPRPLGPFDYRHEVHSRHLWFSEGLTSWYQHLIELRAGHLTPERYLTILASYLAELEGTPGALVQSAEESSHDAWIKFYRPGENSRNSTVSYYGKGAVIGLVLDLEIRERTNGRRSLDDAFRALWRLHLERPDVGFDDGELRNALAEAAGERLDDVLDACVRQAVPLDIDGALAAAGLRLDRRPPRDGGGFLGVVLRNEGGRAVIERVVRDSPAWHAGLGPGEELVAFDGYRVGDKDAATRLQERAPGGRLVVTSVLWGRLREVGVTLAERSRTDYRLRKANSATSAEKRVAEAWLGKAYDLLDPLDESPEEQRSTRGPAEI